MLWWISFGLSQPRLDSVFATKHSLVNASAYIMELLWKIKYASENSKAGPFLPCNETVIFLAVSFVHEPGSAYCPTHFPSTTPVWFPLLWLYTCGFLPAVLASCHVFLPRSSSSPPPPQGIGEAESARRAHSGGALHSINVIVLPCLLCVLSGCWDRVTTASHAA